MGFNDWINFEPAPMSALDRLEEVDQLTRKKVASHLQENLRTVVDPGIDLRSAVRAQRIQVVAEEDRFDVRDESHGDVLNERRPELEPGDPNEVTDVEQLFEMSSGVPSIGADGRLIYRMVTPEALLGEQFENAREQQIEQSTTTTLRDTFIDAFEEAVQDLERQK